MKNIIKLFIGIIFILTINSVFSNRDSVSNVSYGARAHNPLNVTLKFDNIFTTNKNPDYFFIKNLFSYASFSVINGGCTLTKYSNYIKVTYSKSSSGSPSSSHNCTIKVEIDKDDLKDIVNNKLSGSVSSEELEKIKDSITYGLNDDIEAVLKLITDSNGGLLSEYQVELSSYTLRYNYFYAPDTCSDGIDNDDDGKNDKSIYSSTGLLTTPGDPDCTNTCNHEEGCTTPVSKPACSDGIDNDGDGKNDYTDDPNCSSADDTSETTSIIQNTHQIPIIGDLETLNNILLASTSIPGYKGKIIIPADISTYNGFIVLGKFYITSNGTSNGIKKIIATVMNSDATSPLDNNCIYNGSFTSPKGLNEYIPLYINPSCTDIRKTGEYSISFQYVDTEGYTSEEYMYKLKVIPGQANSDKSELSVINSSITKYDDGYSSYKLKLVLKDKYGNLINNRDIIKNINISSSLNEKIYPKQLVNIGTNNNSEYTFDLYNYHYKNNNFNFGFEINKVVPSLSVNNWEKLEAIISFNKNLSLNYTNNISKTVLTGGESDSIYGINMDIPVKFNVYTKNYNNPDNLESVKIKWNPVIKDDNGNNITDKFYIMAATGYESKLTKIKNGELSLGNISKNSSKGEIVKIRVEHKGNKIYGNINLGGSGLIEYNINGKGGDKTIRKNINWDSNMSLKYWGIYVEGSYSNSSKGLYEILRSSSSKMSSSDAGTINKIKLKAYNSIIRNTNKYVRGYNILGDNNTITDLNGIYYNKGKDIILNGGNIKGKSLVYVEGGNVIIKGNITKNGGILTIVAKSDKDGNGGYIEIKPFVTNIDAILVTEKGVFPTIAMENGKLKNYKIWEIIKGNKNSDLNNQLLINGVVISRGNTVGGSIKFNGKYVLPGGKEIIGTKHNFYDAARYDLNYLRRYHKIFNPGNSANGLNSNKYGTYPVVIRYDSSIKTSNPYGF